MNTINARGRTATRMVLALRMRNCAVLAEAITLGLASFHGDVLAVTAASGAALLFQVAADALTGHSAGHHLPDDEQT